MLMIVIQSCKDDDLTSVEEDPDGDPDTTTFVVRGGASTNDYFDESTSMAVDSAGNVYITGHFAGTATFGSETLTSSGKRDVFLAKYNTRGKLLWIRQGAGAGEDMSFSVALDKNANVYIAGDFHQTISFGTSSLTTVGFANAFIVKYDSAGSLQWARKDGTGTDADGQSHSRAVVLDKSGNIYLTGNFYKEVTFGSEVLTASEDYYYNHFVVKYSESGIVQWVVQANGSSSGESVAVDGTGNVYVAGYIQGSGSWDYQEVPFVTEGDADIFIAKINSDGNTVWVKQFGETGASNPTSLAIDASGNIYTAGFFETSINFGSTQLTGGADMFLVKCNNAGDVQWAKQAHTEAAAYDVVVDASNDIYITGYFRFTGTFGPFTLHAKGTDIMIVKYNSSGDATSAYAIGSASAESGKSVAVDNTGHIVITGYFFDTFTFRGITTSSTGGNDIFLIRYVPG